MNDTNSAPGVTLQQLSYFLSAVRTGSLSAAAEENFVAQPSLSDQIRRLERYLGAQLFIRTNRDLILTDAARSLIPHAERSLEATRAGIDAVASGRDISTGTLTFGTFSIGSRLFVPDLIERFHSSYPGVRLRIVNANSVQIADQVRNGAVECGLVALPINDRGLDVEPLEWSSDTVYLSRDASRTQQPISLERLSEAHLVLPELSTGDTDPTRLRLLLNAQKAGCQIVPAIEVDSAASALELAARGIADTVVTYALAHELGMLELLHCCLLEPRLVENFGIIKRRNCDLSPGAAVIVELVKVLLQDIPEFPISDM